MDPVPQQDNLLRCDLGRVGPYRQQDPTRRSGYRPGKYTPIPVRSGSGGRCVVGFSGVGRPRRPPRRGAATGVAVPPEKTNETSTSGPRPDRFGVYLPGPYRTAPARLRLCAHRRKWNPTTNLKDAFPTFGGGCKVICLIANGGVRVGDVILEPWGLQHHTSLEESIIIPPPEKGGV